MKGEKAFVFANARITDKQYAEGVCPSEGLQEQVLPLRSWDKGRLPVVPILLGSLGTALVPILLGSVYSLSSKGNPLQSHLNVL